MEACATPHFWRRQTQRVGHTARLIPPIYVKLFVKRHKNDAAEAQAIAAAVARPTMRYVAVNDERQQARAMLFDTRDLLARQRTGTINVLRGHLAEHGLVSAKGCASLHCLYALLDCATTQINDTVRRLSRLLLDYIAILDRRITELDSQIRCAAAQSNSTRRPRTMPGRGLSTTIYISKPLVDAPKQAKLKPSGILWRSSSQDPKTRRCDS